MEPSEESGGLPMEVDAWEKEASPGPVFGNDPKQFLGEECWLDSRSWRLPRS
jgi:hypothetical protein